MAVWTMWHPGQCPLLWGADSLDPEAPCSLSSFLLWSLSSLACPLLYMTCWPAAQPQPSACHNSSEAQFHHTNSHHQWDSCIKLSVFRPVGGSECFAALGAAGPLSSKNNLCCYTPWGGGSNAELFEHQIEYAYICVYMLWLLARK